MLAGAEMGLQIRETSKWWYGRWRTENGKLHTKALGIKIKGKRPRTLKERGDDAFERSRVEAELKLREIQESCRKRVQEAELLQEFHRIRTGGDIPTITLAALHEAWAELDRRRPPSRQYMAQSAKTIGRFVTFLETHYPAATELMDVTCLMAEEFMRSEYRRGITPKTYNDVLGLLKGTFNRLKKKASILQNPFDDILRKAVETASRKPYDPGQIRSILAACEDDDFIRPVIVIALCTGMRKGDCCLLRWESVDMANRLIQSKTQKTGEPVSIPIFERLYTELMGLGPLSSGYVLPQQASMYQTNPGGITWRVQSILGKAGFLESPNGIRRGYKNWLLPKHYPPAEKEEILSAIESEPEERMTTRKRERLLAVIKLYLEGKSLPEILALTRHSRGTISNYLNDAERISGREIIRGKTRTFTHTDQNTATEERHHGVRRASVRDFHSFRTTWVTLALMANVPMELVRMVTGHRTVEVVLKHYFRPGQNAIRQALERAMPTVLTGGVPQTLEDNIREVLNTATPETASQALAMIEDLLKQPSIQRQDLPMVAAMPLRN